MKLSDFATDLVAGNKFVKAAFGGFAGAGKSRTATEFVIGVYKLFGYTKPVLVIDNEKGSRFLVSIFKKAGIRAIGKDTTSLDDVLTAFDFLKSGEVELCFIDTLTKIYYRYVREYLQKNRKTFMQLDDWGKLLPKWQETFSDNFVAAHGSIVFTGRGGYSYDKEEDEVRPDGSVKKGSYVKSGVKMKLAGETPFEPDLNVWMEREEEILSTGLSVWRTAQILKDRSGLIDGMTFKNPTFADFEPFVKIIADMEQGSVAGETSTRNLAPGENYDNYARRTEKQIALEEVQEEIVKLYPGQTAGDKRGKADLVEKLFGTRSWTAVENLSLERLQEGRNALWLQSRGHAYGALPPGEAPPPGPLDGKPDEGEIPHEAPKAEAPKTEAAA